MGTAFISWPDIREFLDWLVEVYGAFSAILLIVIVYQAYQLRQEQQENQEIRDLVVQFMKQTVQIQIGSNNALRDLKNAIEQKVQANDERSAKNEGGSSPSKSDADGSA